MPTLLHAGQTIRPAILGERHAAFALRLPAAGVRLRCPVAPGEPGDHRRLGFAVTRLRLLVAEAARMASLAELAACEGFHPVEADAWCWSDGDAVLPDRLFAGLAGEAVLLLEGFTPPGHTAAEPAPDGPAIYLAGDSYPRDAYVEGHLFAALQPLFHGRSIGPAAMVAPGAQPGGPRPVAERLARLHRMLDGLRRPERAVLMGRSSGARVATLCAAERRVAAVICLGYPFRPPGQPVEPARFAHLAHATTPTLILQGREDVYGGAEIPMRYPLAPAVRLELLDATHEFYLPAPGWAALARQITLFLAWCGA